MTIVICKKVALTALKEVKYEMYIE